MARVLNQDISIGDSLRRLRERSGLSQSQVAARLEVMGIPMSREILSQMERGVHNINISVLAALKDLYKTPYDEFFSDLK